MAFPYAKVWSKLEQFVSFRFDPQKQPRTETGKKRYAKEKAKVRRYFKTLVDLQGSRQTVVYRPRKRENLLPAQRYAQMPPDETEWMVAFVPGNQGSKVKVRGKSVRVDTHGVSRVVWQFKDFERYRGERSRDPQAVANRILKRDDKSKWFRGLCGESETKTEYSRETMWRLIDSFTTEYKGHSKWFTGVVGYRFSKQKRYAEYKKARANTKRERQRRKRALLKKD